MPFGTHLVMEVPENLKPLLMFRQESVSHAAWITTASDYLRMLIFGYNVESRDIPKLQRMISFIICVYLPTFLAIHLIPSAAERPSIVLFIRDLLLAYKSLDESVFNAVWKRFVHHASQWLSSKKVALSVYAEVPPFTVDALKQKKFSSNDDIEHTLLKKGDLRDFLSEEN